MQKISALLHNCSIITSETRAEKATLGRNTFRTHELIKKEGMSETVMRNVI